MTAFILNIYIYLKKRFPVLIAFVYSSLFAASAVSFFYTSNINWATNLRSTILITATVFLFLLRLRLFDEIKDYSYDSVYHADRPVQQGIIDIKVIKWLAAFVLLVEICLQLLVPIEALYAYGIFLGYSLLMYKEFFLKNFLLRYMLLMLFMHQLIFVALSIYAASVVSASVFIPKSKSQLLFILILFIPPLLFEIGRKFEHRKDAEGKLTDDTYIYRWGVNKTFLFIISLAIIHVTGLFLLFWRDQPFLIAPYALFISAIIILYFINVQIVVKTAKVWSVIFALLGLVLFWIGNLFFASVNN